MHMVFPHCINSPFSCIVSAFVKLCFTHTLHFVSEQPIYSIKGKNHDTYTILENLRDLSTACLKKLLYSYGVMD